MCQVSFLYGHSYASSVLVKKRENSNLQSGENRHYIQFSNFFKFRPLNESLELETIFPQISSPKGMFGRNKKKFDFSRPSFDSRNSQKIALNTTAKFAPFESETTKHSGVNISDVVMHPAIMSYSSTLLTQTR